MPHFEQLYRDFKGKGVNVVALNVVHGTAEQNHARENLIFNRITMPILFNADSWEAQIAKQVKQGRGSLAILDSIGTIQYDGEADYTKIRQVLERLTKSP
jgi:predicted ATP-dependent serine protease